MECLGERLPRKGCGNPRTALDAASIPDNFSSVPRPERINQSTQTHTHHIQMSIRIKDIAFTAYPVTDIPRARAFYC